jgi:hypothetical protein
MVSSSQIKLPANFWYREASEYAVKKIARLKIDHFHAGFRINSKCSLFHLTSFGKILFLDQEDLTHKALRWMLRD